MKDFSVGELTIFFIANAAAAFGLMMALGLFLVKKRTPGNILLGGFWLGFAYWMFITGLLATGLLWVFPAFIWTHTPLAYAMGPFLYLHFYRLSRPRSPLPRRMLIHFAPAIFSAIALVPGWADSHAYRIQMDQTIHKIRFTDYIELGRLFPDIARGMLYTELLKLISVGTKTSLLIYLLVLVRISYFLPGERKSGGRDRRVLNLILMLMCAALTISISNHFFAGKFYLYALITLATIGVFLTHALEQEFPFLKYVVARKEQVYRPPSSVPCGDEMASLIDRFDRLMREEEAYKNDELKIKDVAETLGVKPYRISRALNEKLHRTFNRHVNEFRVEKAREMLRENPDWTVLRISMEVGFNSKSAFHNAFKKITGSNPEEFRKHSRG